ncbi:hypothetical protein [Paenibacillus segetis]|nr:hypothetical protein [Paenibacillus segetis]
MPRATVYSLTDKEKIDFNELTPERVREIANQDMKELYGLDNYYPSSTKYGPYNVGLVQQQIDQAIKEPDKFTGFSMVYGKSHGTEITYKGKQIARYSGYNKYGDSVSTDGFPWDAGWSGRQLHNLSMVKLPWDNKKVISGPFDLFPENFINPIPDKLKEYLPGGNFEQLIIQALNDEYAGKSYNEANNFMYNGKNSEYEGRSVYTKDAAPQGGWSRYVHIIQPPTYLSQGFGRVYMSSTYKDIPIAPFIKSKGADISAEFEDLPTGAATGEETTVSIIVRSNFPKDEDTSYTLLITRKSDGTALTATKDNLEFGGAIASTGDHGKITARNKSFRRLSATFTMPESDVRIQFKINEDGKAPKEDNLDNNVLDSDPIAIKLVTPETLPYDMLSKKFKVVLPSSTVTLSLPNLPSASWTGNATGSLGVYNRTEDLLRDFLVANNPPINEASETITRTPEVYFTIKRPDFRDARTNDDPLNRKYVNLTDPGTPLKRTGEIYYNGSVSRPYQYEYSWESCTKNEKGEDVCTTKYETRTGVVTKNFDPNSVFNPYDMYVYNGRVEVPKRTYKNEIEGNNNYTLGKKLFWTNEPYYFDVIRWMHHQDVEGNKYDWTKVPGQYKREFIQQASGDVNYIVTSSLDEEYSQSRDAAANKTNKKSLYDKAVFATDKELQKYDYPVKSGYYLNPVGSYSFTLETVVFKDKVPVGVTADHKDIVDSLIDSFRYETDLMYINDAKEAVNIRDVVLNKKGGGFERNTGVLSVKDSTGVNGVELIKVWDQKDEPSRYTKLVEEIKSTDKRGGDSHKFWKMILEGYSESYTAGSNSNYAYREYVMAGQHMYKITETTNVTIQVNPRKQMLYTHANMPNGKYNIRVWFDDTNLTKGNHAYKVLDTLKGVKDLDSIEITVVGSMFDDLNN